MLQTLATGEQTVGALAAPFEMSLAAASKHVKALEQAGLIQREVRGRIHVCRLHPTPLATAQEWLRFYERFWNTRLDALDTLLDQAPAHTQASVTKPRTARARTGAREKRVSR